MEVVSTEGEENGTATFSEFPGCGEVPGEVCYLEKDPGTCKETFSVRWFYDVAYGGCSRDGICQHARANLLNFTSFQDHPKRIPKKIVKILSAEPYGQHVVRGIREGGRDIQETSFTKPSRHFSKSLSGHN